jgi:ABC-2 type transport system permease protein
MKEIIRAAFVIARRDFTAIIYSKAFIFFLLGPFFPVLVGFAAGNLGEQSPKTCRNPLSALRWPKKTLEKSCPPAGRFRRHWGTAISPAWSSSAILLQIKKRRKAILQKRVTV